MARRGDHGEGDGVGIEGPSGGTAADATAAATPAWRAMASARPGGNPGNSSLIAWANAAWNSMSCLAIDTLLVPQATALAGVVVGQAPPFGVHQRLLLDQDTLTLVAAP